MIKASATINHTSDLENDVSKTTKPTVSEIAKPTAKDNRRKEGLGVSKIRVRPEIMITQIVRQVFRCNEKTPHYEGCGKTFINFTEYQKHVVRKKYLETLNMTCGAKTRYTPVSDDCIVKTSGPLFTKKTQKKGEYFEEDQ